MTGIEFFLTSQVQDKSKHEKQWEWWVLDSERLQQDIIHVILNVSPEFSRSLIGISGECKRQPGGGTFDLVVESLGGDEVFIELKTDQPWSDTQKAKQAAMVASVPGARCAVILFSQQAVAIKAATVQQNGPQFFKVSYLSVYRALDAIIRSQTSLGFSEFIDGYRAALLEQERRTRSDRGDLEASVIPSFLYQ